MDTKTLDGIYNFMAKAYKGNWQYRFRGAPYMLTVNNQGKTESILAHQWACMSFWYQFRRVSPHLDKIVNSIKLYEMLLNHDLGETFEGDLPAYKFIVDKKLDKADLKVKKEEDEVRKIGKDLTSGSLDEMIKLSSEMENKPENMETVEALLAKYLDGYSGMHFALVFGNDLGKNQDVLIKIIKEFFIRYSDYLIFKLQELGEKGAIEEISSITKHILNKWKEFGVIIEQ